MTQLETWIVILGFVALLTRIGILLERVIRTLEDIRSEIRWNRKEASYR